MAGMASKKENRMASSRSHPSIRAADIVAPLLDIPGKIAPAWTQPIANESLQMRSEGDDFKGKRNKPLKKRSAAVIIKQGPRSSGCSNIALIGLRNSARGNNGSVAKQILQKSFVFVFNDSLIVL